MDSNWTFTRNRKMFNCAPRDEQKIYMYGIVWYATGIRSRRRPDSLQTESFTSCNWQPGPLSTYETICNSIFSTHTLIAIKQAPVWRSPLGPPPSHTPTTQLVDHFTLLFCFSIFRERAASSSFFHFLKADLLLKRIVAVQCSLLIL